MGVSVALEVKGLDTLKRKIEERKQVLRTVLDMKLMQLCEEAVAHAKANKGYKDRTANLKNSISFALYYDGELLHIHEGKIPQPLERKKGQSEVTESLETYAAQEGVVSPTGYSLVIVAGMIYGRYVEDRGYNVLHLTKYYVQDELEKIVEETIKDILQ